MLCYIICYLWNFVGYLKFKKSYERKDNLRKNYIGNCK